MSRTSLVLCVPLVQAQRLLGHSDPKLTARTYSHLEVADLRPAVQKVHVSARAERNLPRQSVKNACGSAGAVPQPANLAALPASTGRR